MSLSLSPHSLGALGAPIKVTKKHEHITVDEPSLEIWTSL
jgi:hypothetical protein